MLLIIGGFLEVSWGIWCRAVWLSSSCAGEEASSPATSLLWWPCHPPSQDVSTSLENSFPLVIYPCAVGRGCASFGTGSAEGTELQTPTGGLTQSLWELELQGSAFPRSRAGDPPLLSPQALGFLTSRGVRVECQHGPALWRAFLSPGSSLEQATGWFVCTQELGRQGPTASGSWKLQALLCSPWSQGTLDSPAYWGGRKDRNFKTSFLQFALPSKMLLFLQFLLWSPAQAKFS